MKRAASSVALSEYCFPSTWGVPVFFTSNSQPCTVTFPPATPRLPNASIAALGGGEFQAGRVTSEGCPGNCWGEETLGTDSARPRTYKSIHKAAPTHHTQRPDLPYVFFRPLRRACGN